MGRQIELDDETVRRIELAQKISQNRSEESFEEYVNIELRANSVRRIVFYADFNRVATTIRGDSDDMTDAEYVAENIDQIEADIEADIEAGEFD